MLQKKNRGKLTFQEARHFELIFGQFLVFFLVTLRVIPSADSSISIFVGQKTHHYQIMSKNSSKTTKPPSKTALDPTQHLPPNKRCSLQQNAISLQITARVYIKDIRQPKNHKYQRIFFVPREFQLNWLKNMADTAV